MKGVRGKGGRRRSADGPVRRPSRTSAPEHAINVYPSLTKTALAGPALWVSVALAAATAAVYAQVWHHQFVDIDDVKYVPSNPMVSQGLSWQGVRWAFTTGYDSNWFPLTWLSHMLDVQLYGLNAGPHHLTALLLHILNSVLLFGLLHRMTKALGPSAFVAALFALHPLHVESVAWVAERKDVLSTFFFFLTLWAYLNYLQRRGVRRYLLLMILYALGLLSKPMLVTLPFVLLLIDIWPLGRVSLQQLRMRMVWPLVKEKVQLFALALASSAKTYMVQQQGGSMNGLDRISLTLRLENALVSYVAYLRDAIWPARLAVYYPYPVSLPMVWVAGSILCLAGISALTLQLARRHRYLLVGWLWYLGMLVPVIGLVQVGGQSRADRYTYVPLVGILMMVAWGVPDLLARWQQLRKAVPAAAMVVALACAVVARRQVGYWQDPITLWTHTLAVTTGNFPAHNNLGLALAGQGKFDDAVFHYREALRIKPDYAVGHLNLGAALASQGKIDEAIATTREAVRIQPDYADAYYNLGVALAFQGKIDEAISEYLEALRMEPGHAERHAEVAALLAKTGKIEEARQHYEMALQLNPGDQQARQALEGLNGQVRAGSPGAP
jgi:protein O-mannosyl-transferase